MEYISTRGSAPKLRFVEAMLSGLATDGGLYVPQTWPSLPADVSINKSDYQGIAAGVLRPLIGGDIGEEDFRRLINAAYASFRDPKIVPLRQLEDRIWSMELFHGPTFAFKDVALQLLGQLYDFILARQDKYITVIGATSGDTGSAAIEACRDKERVRIFMLHPKGRVSDIQRKQMTHIASSNVFNIAIEGSFDDCQELVKGLFAEGDLRNSYQLAAVNSINWARIAAQICYYVSGALQLGNDPLAFSVPSGNFGNVYAGYAARLMGAPIERLIIGTNRNDTLAQFFNKRELRMKAAIETFSPSMDVQIPSNLERLLFELYERDGKRLATDLEYLRRKRHLPAPMASKVSALYTAYAFDDEQTLQAMRYFYQKTGQVIDPHSAIGAAAALADRNRHSLPIITLATAHPAKFPAIIEKALGFVPPMPDALAKLLDMPERYTTLPKDINLLRAYIEAHARKVG